MRAYLRGLLISGTYAMAAGLLLLFMVANRFHGEERVLLSSMIYGKADRPFVYRAFVPFVVRVLTAATPRSLKQFIEAKWKSVRRLNSLGFYQGYEDNYTTEYFYTMAVTFLSIVGILFVMRSMTGIFYRGPGENIIIFFAPILFALFLPTFKTRLIYDYPNLFLFSLALLMLYKSKWVFFYPIYAAACLSKETAILLPFIFSLNYFRREDHIFPWVHLCSQVLIWGICFTLLRYIYSGNPGSFLEFHLFDYNIPILARLSTYFRFDVPMIPIGLNIFIIALLAFMIISNWRDKPLFLRRSLAILIPLLTIAMLFGWIDETRMYLEAAPIMFLLSLPSFVNIIKSDSLKSELA
jgi:hypothetical protein